jgi:uncharacterized protein YpmS
MKKWKRLFWGLFIINIITAIVIMFVLFEPFNGQTRLNKVDNHDRFVELSIKTNKADLNQIINHYIKEEAHNDSVDYQVKLGSDVELLGKINFFDSDIKVKMAFQPEIQENGNMILRQKSMSLGMIEIPVPFVLKYVKTHYSLPKWVTIQPNDQTVYVALNQMEVKSGFKVKVKKFNLEKDDILFELAVPIDN